jgi:hypothetical protein
VEISLRGLARLSQASSLPHPTAGRECSPTNGAPTIKPMKPKTMEMLAWVLIYGGGLLVLLGLAIFDANESMSSVAKIIGIAAIIAGVFLIWLRSRSP